MCQQSKYDQNNNQHTDLKRIKQHMTAFIYLAIIWTQSHAIRNLFLIYVFRKYQVVVL